MIGSQVHFGLIIGTVGAVASVIAFFVYYDDEYEDLGPSVFRGLLIGIGVGLLVWLTASVIASLAGWGYGFGYGWSISLLAAAVSLVAGTGLGVSGRICWGAFWVMDEN